MTLPARTALPDYYLRVQTPIALDTIKQRLDDGYYKTFEAYLADYELMYNNAMVFNKEGSQLHRNALKGKGNIRYRVRHAAERLFPSATPSSLSLDQVWNLDTSLSCSSISCLLYHNTP
jgi:hypothetical protein